MVKMCSRSLLEKLTGDTSMPIYAIENLIPVVADSAFIHPTAVLIGDVIIGAQCYVGPNAVLRGDFGRIELHHGSNIQDNCVMHSFPNKDCTVESNGHIGHGAILHGCHIGTNSLIGMHAVIMDGVVIGEESLVGATAFVKTNFSCPARSMVTGNPAQIRRQLSAKEVAWKTRGTEEYQTLAQRSLTSLRTVEPLSEAQSDRPRFAQSAHQPKNQL